MRIIPKLAVAAASLLATPCLADGPNQPYWTGTFFTGVEPAPGTFMLRDSTLRVDAWRTVGQRGNVAYVNGSYTHHGFSFPAQQPGKETTADWANLAGLSQSRTGIGHRPVPTTVGGIYTLSFYVGNIYDPGGVYGTTSTVLVYENATYLGSFTNSDGQGTKTENWKQFTLTFKAESPYTTIALINGDPPGDMNCGVDDILLTPPAGSAQ